MIELDERDIKAVASNRLFRKHKWRMLGVVVIGLVMIIALGLAAEGTWAYWPSYGVCLVYWVGALMWYARIEGKAQRNLLGEWRKVQNETRR